MNELTGRNRSDVLPNNFQLLCTISSDCRDDRETEYRRLDIDPSFAIGMKRVAAHCVHTIASLTLAEQGSNGVYEWELSITRDFNQRAYGFYRSGLSVG